MTDSDLAAVGGDLAPATLLGAYAAGLFPMPLDPDASDHEPDDEPDDEPGDVATDTRDVLGWFRPQQRGVLLPGALKVSKSLARQLKHFTFTVDAEFERVMVECGDTRREHGWITPEIISAYVELHKMGFAHSVETWRDGVLVGGLYGVALGGLFAGESMFHVPTPAGRDASKAALVALVSVTQMSLYPEHQLIDTQWVTPHLATLGVAAVPAAEYDERRKLALAASGGFDRAPRKFALNN